MASIKKRRGKYNVVYYYTNDAGERKQKWESFVNHKDALARKAEVEHEQSKGHFVAPSNQTIGSFLLDEFIPIYGQKKWGVITYNKNSQLINNYILPIIGNKNLQAFSSLDADRFISELQKTPPVNNKHHRPRTEYMTPTMIDSVYKLITCAFGQAVRWDRVGKNPFANTILPEIRNKQRDIWNVELIGQALDCCTDSKLFVAMNLSFACTLRIGEVCGLMWDNVFIDDKYIENDDAHLIVDKEMTRVSKEAMDKSSKDEILFIFPSTMNKKNTSSVVLKKPKTESSIRKVWIPKTVAQILQKYKEDQRKIKELLGSEFVDYGLVLCMPDGRPCEQRVIELAFNKLKERNDLPDVEFHSLRHSSTTYKLKLNQGDIKATQGDTGHATTEMITRVYAHILDEDRKIGAQKLEAAFYANPDLRNVNKATSLATPNSDAVKSPASVDAETINRLVEALKDSPDALKKALAALLDKA